MAGEVGHLAARDARRDLDDAHRAVVRHDQLREGDAVPQTERVHRVQRDPLRLGERRRRRSRPDRRGSSRRRSRSPGGRSRSDSVSGDRLAVARDHEPVQLEPVVELLDDRLAASATRRAPRAGARRGRRCDSTKKTPRWPPESAGLSTAGMPTVASAARALCRSRARGEARLRHAGVGERAAHRDLVRHQVRRLACRSPAARAPRRPRRRPAPRGRPRRSARRRPRDAAPTSVTAATSVKSTASATSASCEAGRVGVAVDGDDAQRRAPSPAGSRGAGGAPRRRRGRSACRAMLSPANEAPGYEPNELTRKPGTRNWRRLKRAMLATVGQREADAGPVAPDSVPVIDRFLRAAVLLRAHQVLA